MIEVELIDRMENKSQQTQKLIEINRHQLATEFAKYLPDLPGVVTEIQARAGRSERRQDMAKKKRKVKAAPKKPKKARRTKKPSTTDSI